MVLAEQGQVLRQPTKNDEYVQEIPVSQFKGNYDQGPIDGYLYFMSEVYEGRHQGIQTKMATLYKTRNSS